MYDYELSNKIEKPTLGRRFVISDIHGCIKTFKTLIKEKIILLKTDQLFLLGDYIDRGPNSRKVLNYIIKLLKQGYQIYPIRGNHEETLLEFSREKIEYLLWHLKISKSLDLLKNGKLSKKHLKFIETLPYYYELEDFILVHAGLDFRKENPFKDKISMLFRREYKIDKNFLGDKRIIHGHQPIEIDKIEKRIKKRKHKLPLDNGLVYRKKHKIYNYEKLGNLCCLNLDTYELIKQENLDMPLIN